MSGSEPAPAPPPSRSAAYIKALLSNYTLTVINLLLYVAAIPLYVRWLGTERFGVWLVLLQLVYMASLATMWIAAPLTRAASECQVANSPARLGRLFHTASGYYGMWGGLLLLLTVAATPRLLLWSGLEPGTDDMLPTVVLLALSFNASMQLNVVLSLLTGYQRMHVSNLLLAAAAMIATGLGLALVASGAGIAGVAAGHAIGNAIVYVAGLWLLKRTTGARLAAFAFDRQVLRHLLRSGSYYLTYCVAYLVLQTDALLIGLALGPAAVAVYALAARLIDQAIQLIRKIPDALFPIAAELAVRNELPALRAGHRVGSKVATAAALLIGVLLIFFGQYVITLWVGAENTASRPVLVALAGTLVAQVFVHSNVVVPFGANRMRGMAAVALGEAIFKVVLALVLLRRLGVIGVPLATLAAHVCFTGWFAPWAACRLTGDTLKGFLRGVIAPLLLPTAAVTVVLWIITEWLPPGLGQLVTGLIAGIGAWAVLFAGFGLESAERAWIRSTVRRFIAPPLSAIA